MDEKCKKDFVEKIKALDFDAKKFSEQGIENPQVDNENASVVLDSRNNTKSGQMANRLTQIVNSRQNANKSPDITNQDKNGFRIRTRSRANSQYSNLGKSVDYALNKNRKDDLQGIANCNIYEQIKKGRIKTTTKIPANIIKTLHNNRQSAMIENQNNPNNLFKAFYEREESRHKLAKDNANYLKEDITRRKLKRENSETSNKLSDKELIDKKITAYENYVQKEKAYKHKNTQNLVKTLACQINERDQKVVNRNEMTAFEKGQNSKNIQAFQGGEDIEYHGAVPGWGKNMHVTPDGDYSKKYTDIHRINKINAMDHQASGGLNKSYDVASDAAYAKKFTDIHRNLRTNDENMVPRLEKRIDASPEAAYRKKFSDIHRVHQVNRMEWYHD